MAVWHLVLALICLGLLLLFLILVDAPEESSHDDSYGLTILAGAVLTGAGLFSGLLLAGVSLALLGKSFFRPRWSVILVPGLLGTLAAVVGSFVGWPVSEVIGGFVAYHLVGGRLTETRTRAAA